MTIEGNGELIEPFDNDFILYEHGGKMNEIEKDLKNGLQWLLDIGRDLEEIIINKIDKIQVRLEKI